MGAAAYNRASNVIRQRIAADYARPDKTVDLDVNRIDMQARKIAALEAQVSLLENDLSRARRLIRSLRASKTALWAEKSRLIEIATETKQEFLGKRRLAHCYGVIILAKRLGLI